MALTTRIKTAGNHSSGTGSNSRVIMDRAIPFMKDCLKSKSPFFSVIWFHTPHLPVIAGRNIQNVSSYSKYQQHYFGCITAMDEQIGRLRKILKEAGAHEILDLVLLRQWTGNESTWKDGRI